MGDVDVAGAVMYSSTAHETGGKVGEAVVDAVGVADGAAVDGVSVGIFDGAVVDGAFVGIVVGDAVVGVAVGVADGAAEDGVFVGVTVGDAVVGTAVGATDGAAVVGTIVGVAVGDALVGMAVGLADGAVVVGAIVGVAVGDAVASGARVVSGSPDPPPDPPSPACRASRINSSSPTSLYAPPVSSTSVIIHADTSLRRTTSPRAAAVQIHAAGVGGHDAWNGEFISCSDVYVDCVSARCL